MTRYFQNVRKLWLPTAASALALLIAGSTAQTPPPMPTVDLSVGPVAINAQAVNIALALSVEFPTVGSAYRTATYDPAVTYLGYFDPVGCYAYFDTAAGAPLGGEYFYRTGTVDGNASCESSTGRYSGNALNYINTSSIDLLRYALTGGNRVVDTGTTTILERAYLRDSWNLHDGTYFPAKKIPAALVGKVTPAMATGTGPYNGDVYAGGCWDQVYFGTSKNSVGCGTAATTTSGDLNRRVGNPSTLQTGKVLYGTAIPGTAFSPTLGTVTWEVSSSPTRTLDHAPTAGPTTDTFTYYASTTGTTLTAPPVGSGLSNATVSLSYTPVTTGTTTASSAVATSTYPTLGSEPDRSIQGYTTASLSTGMYDTNSPPLTQVAPGTGTPFVITNSNTTRNYTVCKNGSRIFGPISSGNPSSSGVNNSWCNSQLSGSTSTTLGTALGWTNGSGSVTKTFYRTVSVTPYYKKYTITKNMQNWEARTGWYEYDQWQYYTYYSGTQAVPMYARVKVCDDAEKTIRPDLCERYPDGNYKPIGEIQRYSTGVRVSAFGYLKDDSSSAYGGVLRAPMKYMGPTYTDPNGQPQTNTAAEWDGNNGVFATNPLGATSPFATSGVINYLNKFGTSGAVKGYYKGLDPVGELYYEALRYFQGLQPSSQATSVYTSDTTKADGFPVYTTWTDPVQNACERSNFILTIGDVNTHYDKQLPGHRSPNGVNSFLTEDPARAVVTIPGSTATFDAVAWTDLLSSFETGTNTKSYQHWSGTQWTTESTAGNPSPNTNNTNLSTTATGSGNHSAYYWAGAAYWANTQPIRWDTKDGQSMRDIRVKTFTIDVDEGGNGDIEDSNPRSIKPRRSSFYLAGKYGWFKDSNLDGNPFKNTGGTYSNAEWQDPAAPNTPDGYVIASQAQKLVSGIRKFFAASATDRGAVSVSAISSARYTTDSPNGDFFSPQFSAGDWSGTVKRSRLVLNTTTQTVESTTDIVWDAARILNTASIAGTGTLQDPYVRPADRNIITMATISGATTGVLFNVANKNQFDSAVLTALNTNPTNTATDNLADQRINWIRGSHSNEMNAGTLRVRTSIMGDVINSGPVYKQAADPTLTGTGYLAFADSVKDRPAMIYVGANDGMLHAFRADNGKELFAYIPRAVAPYLNKLTHPNYVHRPYVDGVPQVGEAQVGENWKTLLVSGMGGGAQGIFALDVSDPTSFGVGNVMFEFTDANDPDMGNVLTQPTLVKLKVPGATASDPATEKWFIAVGSGYNNYRADGSASTTGAQAMFFLSVDKPANEAWSLGTNYFKVVLPVSDTTKANGLVNPGFVKGPNGVAQLLYAGDLQGNLWKFDLSSGISSTNLSTSVFQAGGARTPIFVALSATGTRQPITTTPQIVEANAYGYMVVFGTGKFLEPSDTATADQQSIYGIWDSLESTAGTFAIARNKLYPRPATLSLTSVTLGGSTTFVYGTGTGQYRGWLIDLPETRERIAVESALGIGAVVFKAAIPEGTCSGDGAGRMYCLNPVYGTSVCGSFSSSPGIPSGPKIFQIELDDSSYTARSPSGMRSVTIEQQAVSSSTKITDAGNALVEGKVLNQITIPAGRVSWKQLSN